MDFRKVLFSFRLVFMIGICFSLWIDVRSESLDEIMKSDPDISQFWSMLEQCHFCNLSLHYETMTVFAPINAAFQHMPKIMINKDSLVKYHLTNAPKRTDQLGNSYTAIMTRSGGSPPIWVTHTSGRHYNDVYVNNARILVSKSNIETERKLPEGTIKQILHKIDEVLIPTGSLPNSETVFNPTAWEFLERYDSLIQGPHRVRYFKQKVEQNDKQEMFRTEGGHTFFIPVDDGFANSRASLVDDKIIDGHVIPRQVLFTTPTKKDVPFQTMANRDNVIRVVISFTQEQQGDSITNYVKSNTLLGDGTHRQGVVLAEIVKANIPVKNGVIHLIHKPLMIVDSTIKELLQDKDGGILNNFFDGVNDLGPAGQELLRTIEKSKDVTLFAPCNSALEGPQWDNIKKDKQRLLEILKLHLVVDNRLYVDDAMKKNKIKLYQVPTLAQGKNLYFNVAKIGTNQTMTVEAGGVNATVIQPDLAAKNGLIHIIDKVLGVPYNTVLDKLRTDPMLRDTFYLGSLEGFNNQLNDTTKKYTYFVPRDKAWKDVRVVMPSSIKVLFMKEFSYHATTTLQRHLVIADEVYTMERIKQLTRNGSKPNQGVENNIYRPPPSIELPSQRGSLRLYVEEKPDYTFVIHWNEIAIPVFRPNVECTNGIIHVIDLPFLQKGDIVVAGSDILKPSAIVALICGFPDESPLYLCCPAIINITDCIVHLPATDFCSKRARF